MKKGYKWTLEHRLSRSILYKKYFIEGRIKLPSTLGKKLNTSFFGKLRTRFANRFWSVEAREKQRLTHKGKPKMKLRGVNHYLWKGGITEKHHAIRNSLDYKIWREKVFSRDNWTCQICNARSTSGHAVILQADHIKSFSKFPDLRFDVSNGRTLCLPCHKMTPNFGVRANTYETA